MIKRIFCFDLETLNIFTATFIDKDSDDTRVFVLTSNINQISELLNFLNTEVSGLIGYNSISFDAQVLEFIYRHPNCTAEDIRRYAQIITSDDNRRPDVPEWKLRIPQLDLFRALSLSVKAKRVGLKWCEFMLDMDNIEDMPSQGEGDNWLDQVLAYNYNDVVATKILYNTYKHEILLRIDISNKEGVNLLNSTEPDISKKLLLKYLSRAMEIPANDLRSLSTDRPIVQVKDIIFPYVEFTTFKFQQAKKHFESLYLKEYDKADLTINYKNIDINFGLGGLHASVNNQIVESDKDYIIKSLDVVSYYPNLMIKNHLHPAHIPQDTFLNLYEDLFNQRRAIPKSNPKNYILKIILNSVYGLTNDKFSFLRDRQVTLSICINGQLLLMQLIEQLIETIPEAIPIMINTDGCEIKIPRQYEELYNQICKDWEQLTKLQLEFVDYSKMIISDVNNYLAVYTNGKTKCKGKYEFENIPLHKNKSHSIIARAVYNYYVNNVNIETTIKNHTNIYDFCAGVKARNKSEYGDASRYELRRVVDNVIVKERLSKTVRYFISVKGSYLYKVYSSGSEEHVEAPTKLGSRRKDWKVTYFNKAFYPNNFADYDIDYSYYISKAREWIIAIEDKNQLNLFI